MPIHYSCPGDVVHTVLSGHVTDDELIAHYSLPVFASHTGQWLEIVDGRDLETNGVTREGQSRLAILAASQIDALRGGLVAMVASRPVSYGLFRMWEMSRDHLPYAVAVFNDYDSACLWIASSRWPVPQPQVPGNGGTRTDA